MKCEEARFLFAGRVEERLAAEDLSNLEAHLTVCPVCPREWERFLQSVPRLRSAPKPEASPGSAQPVVVTATLEPSYPRWLQILFFPLHVKLPLMAVAIILVWTLVGLLFRQGPELRRAPESPAAVAPAPSEQMESGRAAETPTVPPPDQSVSGPSSEAQDRDLAKKREDSSAPLESGRREAGESRTAAPSAARSTAQVSAVLRPKTREAIDRQLESLVREAGGTLVVDTSGVRTGSVVEIVVAKDNYPKLEAGLRQIGDLRVESSSAFPDQVQVRIRIQ